MSRRLRPLAYQDRLSQLARAGAPKGFGGRLSTQGAVTLDSLPAQARNPVPGVSHPGFWVLVAPADAPLEWKRQAHFVASGTDDQDTLDAADDYVNTLVGDIVGTVSDPALNVFTVGGVFVAPGTLNLSGTASPSYAKAWACIPGTVVIAAGSGTYSSGGLFVPNVNSDHISGDPLNHLVHISGFVFNGNEEALGLGLELLRVNSGAVRVTDCAFVNGDVGAHVFDEQASFARCHFEENSYGAWLLGAYGHQMTDCTFYSNDQDVDAGDDTTLTGCMFYGSGITSYALATSPASAGVMISGDRVTLQGCRWVGCVYGLSPVEASQSQHYTLVGCHVDSTSMRVTLDGFDGHVSGCTFDAGVEIVGTRVRLSDCYVLSTGDAVQVVGATDIVLQDVTADPGAAADAVSIVGSSVETCRLRLVGNGRYGLYADGASTVRVELPDVTGTWTQTFRIVGEQQVAGREMVLEHVAVSGVVTSDPSDIDVTLSSDWGIQAADGDPYYDPAGATSGEEAELLHDPVTDAYFLREIA